jgi:hypothetical protein
MNSPETRGGYQPKAPQNNPANVNGLGGNGTSGDYTGFAYGQNQAINQSREAGNAAISQMNVGQPSLTESVTQTPIPSILDETQDKNQSIMDGAPIGPGANSLKGLPRNPSNDPDIDIIRDQYPIMQVWASMPGTSRQTADFVNYLGQII